MRRYPDRGLEGASPGDLVWLTGSWQGRVGDDVVEEHWSSLRGNTLMAMFRWVRDGLVLFYEIEVIEQEGELVFLRIKHFDPKLIGWEEKDAPHEFVLVELDDEGAVFLELDRPDPRWAVYRRKGPNDLIAYFTRGSEPDAQPGIFELTRR
jgi:Domain of unknown function (DUF6265)